jgi:hypothetical protein
MVPMRTGGITISMPTEPREAYASPERISEPLVLFLALARILSTGGGGRQGPELRRVRVGCGVTRGLSKRCATRRSGASLSRYSRVPRRRTGEDMVDK